MAEIDDWLSGGLRRDGLHEFYAAGAGDESAAMMVALLLALQGRRQGRPILWLREEKGRRGARPYAPGLKQCGIDPDALLLVRAPDGKALLRAAIATARHGGAGAMLLEVKGRAPLLDLTASRRLALAAEARGMMAMIVRSNAEPTPSVAHSRWRVASAPSQPLAANAPGHPVFHLTLLRQRSGRDGIDIIMEWDREHGHFRPALPRGASALPAGRAAGTGGRRAA